jgi:outer membrane scaffolding protein for murein synthesis (MipA/OmpV family)
MASARIRPRPLALAFVAALAVPAAFAQSFDAVHLSGAAPGHDGGTVGLAVVSVPEYPGSDERRVRVLPVLDYQWASGWFAGVANGIGYNFSDAPQVQYGLRLTADAGRREHRARALHGMGDVDPAAEGGAFFNYALPQGLLLTSSVRYGAGARSKGLVVDLGASFSVAIATQWHLGLGAGATLANAHYMQSYFGVSPAQAGASGRAVYTPAAGVRDVHANMALTLSIDPKTAVTAALSACSLTGDSRASPLTRRRTSESGVVAVTYAF